MDDIDQEYVQSGAFTERVLTVVAAAVGETEPERLKYLADFLVAASRHKRPDENWLNLLWRYLSQLSGTHILVLDSYYQLQRGIPASDRLGSRELKNVPVVLEAVMNPHLDRQLVQIASADLANLGLLADWRAINGGARLPASAYTMTRNGVFFLRYLDRDWETPPGVPPAG